MELIAQLRRDDRADDVTRLSAVVVNRAPEELSAVVSGLLARGIDDVAMQYRDVMLRSASAHGVLELTAVFVSGAAGLRLFWTLVDPGPRPRSRALAEEGRALFTVALGLVGVLAVSGVIEGFVTGSHLAWGVKIAIGLAALAGFWAYVLVLGGRAARAGQTGDLELDRAGYAVATAG